MSLIITDVSQLGIAMAADSAASVPNRVFIGFQKLLPIREINAGLSFWGVGEINDTDADIWLQNFIDTKVIKGMKLWNVAEMLAKELNTAFGKTIDERMGIHLAGFDEYNNIRGPAFYHIHNGNFHFDIIDKKIRLMPEENPPIREFRAHRDCPPGSDTFTRNGDYKLFGYILKSLEGFFETFSKIEDLKFPFPENLAARGEMLRFWINFMSEFYRLSNQRERPLPEPTTGGDAHIGGPISVLTINKNGIQEFYRR